jgi:hypothetical protein
MQNNRKMIFVAHRLPKMKCLGKVCKGLSNEQAEGQLTETSFKSEQGQFFYEQGEGHVSNFSSKLF